MALDVGKPALPAATASAQHWQVETAISMIKRRPGSAANARSYRSQCRALMLKAVAHHILMLHAHAPAEPLHRAA